ncbi:two-component system QseEF-associated lipoprotein QseG [Erwinia pyrifoliae]|uniref:Two-component system QseEF-associated lipoprotein QseG n=1 Tax=Erwinia pyrifoliae TaxID=79967 RepID=A0ABY5XAI4_ERWPY|nr:two-component system QseEF-associated lipoprotein QseG [Erwinia pyrifoliae]AUX73428.1 two-component system QseEF-associated lipoprotein QseG [Erwinia pyrifoliae]MCA8876275.1 two-component system QseEF-associated lipoprotein QseG [Erwinia pyrifoliae]MCT2386415.1 two-component system QseEF-associated lipoprotein QseG [Erwinia pyrifoliae]MCU8587988.1 two-component system QseEF-associated lipoprotein QseG [Erwinia pyrifoliae]UWS28393.1 two-component system QseEF-associated lipoprotein QseG [Erw
MQLARFIVVLQRRRCGRSLTSALLALILTACCQNLPQKAVKGADSSLSEPENSLADFRLVNCERIWSWADGPALENPLYWQRAIDCAVRLSPADARAEAKGWPADNWQNAFRQAVLLSNGNVTSVERRHYLQRLDNYGADYPAAVRPLLMLWREGQGALLQLSAERTRYAFLQQKSDAELDALRQQQTELRKDLASTRRKLDRLTDIERQLSSRRTPEAAENSGQDDGTAGKRATDEANP